MILAIGSDLCNIERIQASLDRFGGLDGGQRPFVFLGRNEYPHQP